MPTTNTDSSLAAATKDLRTQLQQQLPGEALAVFDRDAGVLSARDFAKDAPAVGERAPDFNLPDARGGELRLSSVLSRGPAVVVFYRGAWCPYYNLQLAAFQAALEEIESTGATLIAISPQTPDASLSLVEQKALRFPVLSDLGNTVAKEYGLVFTQPESTTMEMKKLGIDLAAYNNDDSEELPASSTFVIAADRTVVYASVSGDYRWRVGPHEVLEVLRELREHAG